MPAFCVVKMSVVCPAENCSDRFLGPLDSALGQIEIKVYDRYIRVLTDI